MQVFSLAIVFPDSPQLLNCIRLHHENVFYFYFRLYAYCLLDSRGHHDLVSIE